MSIFSSFWCQGLAAVCDCGTPWTFSILLTFYVTFSDIHDRYKNFKITLRKLLTVFLNQYSSRIPFFAYIVCFLVHL